MEETVQTINASSNNDTPILKQLLELIETFDIEPIDFPIKHTQKQTEDELKKLKKKFTKQVSEFKELISSTEDSSKIQSKINKIIDNLKSSTEEYASCKSIYNTQSLASQESKEESKKQKEQKERYEKLHKVLTGQYQEQIEANKIVQEEEAQKRKDLVDSFQQKIKDIQTAVEEKSRDRIQKEKENEILKDKLRETTNQFQTNELIFSTQLQKKDLEMKLHEAQLGQELNVITSQAKKFDEFKEELEKQKQIGSQLEERLQVYLDQDKKFTDAMVESNSKFSGYKATFDGLIESQRKYENANTELRRKSEKTDTAIFDILEKNLKVKEELDKQKGQLSGLESLLVSLEKQLQEKEAAKQVPQQ